MRYTPVAIALSFVVAVSSSAILSAPTAALDPRAATLMTEGHAAIGAGNINGAIDAFEAALTVEPGNVSVLLALADATRQQGLQGKALRYYRVALVSDPRNVAALAGEGMALAEKGAKDKASRNLARLQTLCGKDCAETEELAAAIAKVPATRVMTAEASAPKPVVSEN